MDKFIELSKRFRGKVLNANILNGNLNSTSTRRIVIKDYESYKVVIEDYGDRYLVGIPIDCNLAFSVNNPDRVFAFRKLASVNEFSFKIYTSDDDSDNDQLNDEQVLLFLRGLGRCLSDIELLDYETVYVYNNYIYFSLSSSRDFSVTIKWIVSLVVSNRDILFSQSRRERISMAEIPAELRTLTSLIKQFGIADDLNRDELINKMSRRDKENLVKIVGPLLTRINSFLDSFRNSERTETAIQIAALAEMVSELKLDNNL
jgi:hypothetical protein